MRACRRAVALATALFALGTGGAFGGVDLLPVDEVRPGDRCVARSVFFGTEVEEFGMEVLGVVRGTAPGSDLIIARAEGEFLERTGIPQGMSGSPVYRDGKLLGAISSTWAFSKEPVAGITPIDEMLPALERSDGREGAGATGSLGLLLVPPDERPRCGVARVSTLAGLKLASAPYGPRAVSGQFGGREMQAISLPLTVPCGAGPLAGAAAELLGGLGLTPVQGAAGTSGEPPGTLVPGSSVGVQFVGGDMSWTAIGTLTYIDGDRVVAFGHPVFGAGDVELPLVGARVHTVLPLSSLSFKYASGTGPVGVIYSDRRRGVGGVLGPAPDTMPLSVSVGLAGRDPVDYRFEIIRTRPFSSTFAGLAAAGAVTEAAIASGRASIDLRIRLETTDGPITYGTRFHTMEPALRAGGELGALIDLVLESGVADVDVKSASLDAKITAGELLTTIERVTADRTVYHPGDPVRLTVELRDRSGERSTRSLVLVVPEGTGPGPLLVRVSDASAFHEWDAERLGDGLRPRTWKQLRDLVEGVKPGNTVVAQLLSDRGGLSLSGREMARPPGKAALVMGAVAGSGAVATAELTVLSEASLSTEWETLGAHEFVVYADLDD